MVKSGYLPAIPKDTNARISGGRAAFTQLSRRVVNDAHLDNARRKFWNKLHLDCFYSRLCCGGRSIPLTEWRECKRRKMLKLHVFITGLIEATAAATVNAWSAPKETMQPTTVGIANFLRNLRTKFISFEKNLHQNVNVQRNWQTNIKKKWNLWAPCFTRCFCQQTKHSQNHKKRPQRV